MPSKSPFVLTDGKATPVTHTFNPTQAYGSTVEPWEERSSSGVPLGASRLEIEVQQPKGKGQVYRVKVKIQVPHLISTTPPGATAPVSSVDYTDVAMLELAFHQKSTTQDRKDLRSMLIDLLSESQFSAASDGLEGFW